MAKDDMTRTPLKRCSFCGKTERQVMRMVAGANNVCICNECIMLCQEIISDAMPMMHSGHPQQEQKFDHLPSPAEMKQVLDDYVIGQEHAKRALCVAVYNHYKRIGQRPGKDDVELQKSNILMVGPTGCGKSTLLKTLNRMNDLIPDVKITGSVKYRDADIFDPTTDVNELRRQIGMVFQKPNPFPMSIYDNVAYGPRTHGIRSKAKLDETVERSLRGAAIWDEVKDRLKKNALGLSGGQQQRLCIARALAVEPEVLLMDEPTSALDPISTSKIEELAINLKEKYTIIIVTHNMQQAVRISDNTAFFLLGELIEYGATEEIFSQPKDRRTEDYITGRFG